MINDDRLNLKCTTDEKAAWKRAASIDNRPLSNWIKRILNEAAELAIKESEDQDTPDTKRGK